MSRILKRPMFRIGGSTNEGIVSMAEPRKNYQGGSEYATRIEELKPIYQQALGSGRSERDRALDLLLRGSIRLASETPRGGIIPTAAKAFQEPVEQYLKAGETEDALRRQVDLAAVTQGITSVENERLQRMKLADEIQKIELAKDKLFLETSGLGAAGPNVLATKKKLQKQGIPVLEGIVASTGDAKTAKPVSSAVLAIPEGTVFFDIHGNFYKRVKESPGYQRTQYSGEEIKVEPKAKKQTFIDNITETSPDDIIMRQYLGPAADLLRTKKYDGGMTTVDPRPWNKQKFYEDLLKKNKASME